ncbi:MAG: hypothetical protein IH991_22085 [Planctomycetes bacterium]|nr:hypothetical protein [Planctomycetota bacterium]
MPHSPCFVNVRFVPITVAESFVDVTQSREEETSVAAQSSAQTTGDIVDDIGAVILIDDDSREDEELLFFTIVDVNGKPSEMRQLPLDLLNKDKLFDLFQRFPNNKYRIYYKEAGTPEAQLLYELNVFQQKIQSVPFDVERDMKQQLPNRNEGAENNVTPDASETTESPGVAPPTEPIGEQQAVKNDLEDATAEATNDSAASDQSPSPEAVRVRDESEPQDRLDAAIHPRSKWGRAILGGAAMAGIVALGNKRWTKRVADAMESQEDFSLRKSARLNRRIRSSFENE